MQLRWYKLRAHVACAPGVPKWVPAPIIDLLWPPPGEQELWHTWCQVDLWFVGCRFLCTTLITIKITRNLSVLAICGGRNCVVILAACRLHILAILAAQPGLTITFYDLKLDSVCAIQRTSLFHLIPNGLEFGAIWHCPQTCQYQGFTSPPSHSIQYRLRLIQTSL